MYIFLWRKNKLHTCVSKCKHVYCSCSFIIWHVWANILVHVKLLWFKISGFSFCYHKKMCFHFTLIFFYFVHTRFFCFLNESKYKTTVPHWSNVVVVVVIVVGCTESMVKHNYSEKINSMLKTKNKSVQ